MELRTVGLCLLGASLALAGTGAVVAGQHREAAPEPAKAGQWVHLDENGNRVAAPDGATQAAPPAAEPSDEKAAPKENAFVEGGGFEVDLSHVRAYSTAHIEDGKLHKDCTTKHSDPACAAKE